MTNPISDEDLKFFAELAADPRVSHHMMSVRCRRWVPQVVERLRRAEKRAFLAEETLETVNAHTRVETPEIVLQALTHWQIEKEKIHVSRFEET